MNTTIVTCLMASCLGSTGGSLQNAGGGQDRIGPDRPAVRRYLSDRIQADGRIFSDWTSLRRHLKQTNAEHTCGNRDVGRIRVGVAPELGFGSGQMDCAGDFTNPDPMYAPEAGPILNVDVVFHIIRTPEGLGHIEVEDVLHTLQRLNEEFSAITGTLGEEGIDSGIRFRLAETNPDGEPTFGIRYHDNAAWFADPGSGAIETEYADQISWDTSRYLNIYTNDCGFSLGYATIPQYDQGPEVGASGDRIVLRWDILGVNPPYGEPYDLNRVLVHEVGHWCGLWHVFTNINPGVCDGDCRSTGDTICDTGRQNYPTWGCEDDRDCGTPNSYRNHMSYSDDTCRSHFTPEQVRRMRCTLMHWRPLVFEPEDPVECDSACPADLDRSGMVDVVDLSLFLAAWGPTDTIDRCADLDEDGVVDGIDLGLLMVQWGRCTP